MSPLMLLLTLSVAGFPPLESFLVSPRASIASRSSTAPRLLQRQGRETASTLQVQRWILYNRNHESSQMKPRESSLTCGGAALRASASPEATEGANDSSNANKVATTPPKTRQRTKTRPREHFPVNKNTGDDQPRVIEGSLEGAGPWVGAAGPAPTSPFGEPSYDERAKFMRIMEDLVTAEKEEELPSKLTKHIAFLLSVDITRLTNDMIRQEPTMDRMKVLHNAYDFVVTFLEGMVENALEVQKTNRTLLREIIETAKIGPEKFERKMDDLEERLNYDFVQYLDAEISRLEKEDTTPGPGGGNEVLNVMKVVRTRVCAQLDLMLGEDVAVLTRMLSYDDRYMMRAALRAVLEDRHEVQIQELRRLISTTLDDVNKMKDADPLLRHKLVDMVDDMELLAKEWTRTNEEIALEEAEEEEAQKQQT